MIPVEGHKNLYRDENSNAIVNCDIAGYNHYVRMRDEKRKQKEEIEQLKNDVNEIKFMLKELLNAHK